MAIRTPRPATHLFERVAAIGAALLILCLAIFLLVRNKPIADPQLFFVMRVVLSFAVATLGATIPGFLDVGWKGGGLAIRAGGALALFVLTYVYTPDLARNATTTITAPNGVAAHTIDKSTITINPAQEPRSGAR